MAKGNRAPGNLTHTTKHNASVGSRRFSIRFETSNGISREETGEVINPGQEDQYIKVYGLYSYKDTNGEVVNVIYGADKDGYHIESGEEPISLPPAAVASLLG
ncbi:endocuticle structural glycoprotein SgAbd-5-like isoform X1 [Spodoptera frugiperda]|uniref:Endocuticle structural glycoprotein SgAbd-5-like isoform X1 n=1 Tax=Spodoptera frugiperda TaxID=7108 RepID=A0A9R0E353_SPOFR|nr:endocuticle structural glycoprotein SgAbd-5-like isoform X1 [Spodoptera frugiperda]